MKNIIVLLLVGMLFSCIGNNRGAASEDNGIASHEEATCSLFNPALGKAVNEFIEFIESEPNRGKVYKLMSYKVNDIPVLFLKNSHWYDDDKERTKYYYINGSHLFIYEVSDTTCLSGMIDVGMMTVFQDSIPGFDDGSEFDGEYDPKSRVYKIINQDSLEIIYTGIFTSAVYDMIR